MKAQGGVISRRQVRALGGDDNLVERMLRRRLWCVIHPGVYVDHTGTPTDEQLRMAAVLYAWPAVLAGESALVAHGVRNISAAGVTVAIDTSRRVRARPGMRVLRVKDVQSMTLSALTPERLRLDDAVLQVASARWRSRGEGDAVALLSDVCQQRRTTPERLLAALAGHRSLPGRAFLTQVLDDVASGAYSLLEHRYLTRVEGPHGLPRGNRQQAFTSGERKGFRDVHYPDQATLELDGDRTRVGDAPVGRSGTRSRRGDRRPAHQPTRLGCGGPTLSPGSDGRHAAPATWLGGAPAPVPQVLSPTLGSSSAPGAGRFPKLSTRRRPTYIRGTCTHVHPSGDASTPRPTGIAPEAERGRRTLRTSPSLVARGESTRPLRPRFISFGSPR